MSTCLCVWSLKGGKTWGAGWGEKSSLPIAPRARAELQGAWESKLNFPGCEDTFVKESIFYLTVC